MHQYKSLGWSKYLILAISSKIINQFLKTKGEAVKYFTLALLSLLSVSAHALGLKIVKQFPHGILTDVMPWDIDEADGWFYIASDEGLVQFDGATSELFFFNNRRPVRSVAIDRENNRILAGGISEFGYFKSTPLKSLDYVCLSDSVGNDKQIGNIWGIYENDGKVIAQGDRSILIYDLHSGAHSIIDAGCKLDGSSMINGVIWLATDDGLKLLLASQIVNAPNSDELKGKRIRKIL